MRWVSVLLVATVWPSRVSAADVPHEPPAGVLAEQMEDRAVGMIVFGSILTFGGLVLMGTGAVMNFGEEVGTDLANGINATLAGTFGDGTYQPAPEPEGHSDMVIGGAATAIGGAVAIVIGCVIYGTLDEAPPITAAWVPTRDGGAFSATLRF